MKQTFRIVLVLLLFNILNLYAQNFETPRPSPNATVTQTVGVTHISIDYSSPGVKGRKIWGGLVPYGDIWRTGANEVTSITFSDPVKLNGNDLPAGTYGIHTIPGENEWQIIFSYDTEVNGSSVYDGLKDVLRIKVKPVEAPFTERMIFTITDMTDNSAIVNLTWEKLEVSFLVEVDTQNLTLKKARNSADWGMLLSAATYCLQQNIKLEEGFNWIQASVLINETYWNLRIKAQYLEKMNKKEDAIVTMEKAIEHGSKMDNAPFDYERMKELLAEWKSQ